MTTPPNHNTADQSGADERAKFIDEVERLAFSIPYQNSVTPQLVMLCVKARAALASTQPAPQAAMTAEAISEWLETDAGKSAISASQERVKAALQVLSDARKVTPAQLIEPMGKEPKSPVMRGDFEGLTSGGFGDMPSKRQQSDATPQPFPAPAVQPTVPQVVQAPMSDKDYSTLLIDSAAHCSDPEQFEAIEKIIAADAAFAARLIRTINRLAAPIVATVPSEFKDQMLSLCDAQRIDQSEMACCDTCSGLTYNDACDDLKRKIRELAAPSPTEQAGDVRNAALTVDIEQMVNRFLSWKLPQTFAPDCGILFKQVYADSWPTGTNLFHAGEAKAMFQHCLDTAAAKVNAPDEVKS